MAAWLVSSRAVLMDKRLALLMVKKKVAERGLSWGGSMVASLVIMTVGLRGLKSG